MAGSTLSGGAWIGKAGSNGDDDDDDDDEEEKVEFSLTPSVPGGVTISWKKKKANPPIRRIKITIVGIARSSLRLHFEPSSLR